MSYVWKTKHPMVRRQQYLDRKKTARQAYFVKHPEEAQRSVASFAVLFLGVLMSVAAIEHSVAAFVILTCSIAVALFLAPKNLPK